MSHLTAQELDLCRQVRTVCACNQLRRVARGVTQRYERAVAASGVKATQLPILVALGAHGAVPITPLADALALERTTLTRNLRVLEARGLVTTSADAGDARVRRASLTDEGARVLSAALALWEDAQRGLEEAFGQPRLLALYDELTALAGAAER